MPKWWGWQHGSVPAGDGFAAAAAAVAWRGGCWARSGSRKLGWREQAAGEGHLAVGC